MSAKLTAALDAARRGFKVFPLVPNTKIPLKGFHFKELATGNESQIRKWWKQDDYNIAIYTDELLVIDVDVRKDGPRSLAMLRLFYGHVPTATSVTATGGLHLIYSLPPGEKASGGANKLAEGLDVKTTGGYIVAPGSSIDRKFYEWAPLYATPGQALTPAPDWLRALCVPTAEHPAAGKRLVAEDETARKAAWEWLDFAPTARQGERGIVAYRVAAKLYEFGVERETCGEYLAEWSATHCDPPMDPDDVTHAAASAEHNMKMPIGWRHPLAPGFEPVDVAPRMAATPVRTPEGMYFVFPDMAASQALSVAGAPLIKGMLECGKMSVWYGESGGGKSFLLADALYGVAKGGTWAGMKVKQGAVVYLAAEGGKSAYKRMAAWAVERGDLKGLPFYLVPCMADFLHGPKDVLELLAIVRDIEKQGQKVVAIAVDTLSRVLAGGDENGPSDMGALVKTCDRIINEADTHLALVHHTGKDKARGARGHSILRAATDTEIEIMDHVVTVTKQRDMEQGMSFRFGLKKVQVGVDADGDPVTSCVVEIRHNSQDETFVVQLDGEASVFADKIEEMLRARCDKNQKDIKGQTFRTHEAQKIAEPLFAHEQKPKSKALLNVVDRLLLTMLKSGWLSKSKRGQWVWALAHDAQDAQT